MTLEQKPSSNISVENLFHISVCIGILVVFVVYAILPVYREYETLNTRVRQLKCGLAEHALLLPLYTELKTELNQPEVDALIAIKVEPLIKEDFSAIHNLMQGMSEECGLTLLKTAPHVFSLPDERRFLGVNISAEGAFSKMRMFLQNIMQMPSFFHIESVKIVSGVDQEQLDVEIWLSVK